MSPTSAPERKTLKFRHSTATTAHKGVKTLFFLAFCAAGALFLWTPSLYLWNSLKQYKIMVASSVPSAAFDDAQVAARALAASDGQPSISAPAQEVTLTLLAPAARRVYLGGSFNNFDAVKNPMKLRPDGIWEARLRLTPGRYLYKFKVDGEWTLDPTNPQKTLEPRSASILDLP